MSAITRWIKRIGFGLVMVLLLGGGYIAYSISEKNKVAPPDPLLDTRDIQVNSGGARIDARLYRKKDESPTVALLWMHGGAFAGGTINMPEGDQVSRTFAHAGVLVLSVEYRKVPGIAGVDRWFGSPEIRFPEPVQDCVAAWRELLKQAAALNIPVERTFIGGASAGGNLAAMTNIFAAREGLPQPRGLLLAYPMLHSSLPGFDGVRTVALAFVGKRNEARIDEAFPQKGDLGSFPPTIIINSDEDPLRPSGEKFARELAEAGRSVVGRTEAGSVHGHLNEPSKPEYDRTMMEFIGWMKSQVGSAEPSQ